MKIFIGNTRLLILAAFFIFLSCQNKTSSIVSTDNEGYDKNLSNNNYDWTGTYELKDNEILYTLKLHKRSVDANYEMQFYNNSKDADLYKSSIYDAKDGATSINIRFLNNFNMDASALGFKSGDTLFILHRINSKDSTILKSFKSRVVNASWEKTSNNYN